jgi:hypothetical protein
MKPQIHQDKFLTAQLNISMVEEIKQRNEKIGYMTGKYMSTQHLIN